MKSNLSRFIILFLLIFEVAFCQMREEFEKGSITLVSGEQIEGFLKSTDFKAYANTVCFKKQLVDRECNTYDYSQVKYFQTESGKKFEILAFNLTSNNQKITLFANQILLGKVSLYKSYYNRSEIYLIKREDQSLVVLQNDYLSPGDHKMTRFFYERNLNMATNGYLFNNFTKFYFKESFFLEVIKGFNDAESSESVMFSYKEKNSSFNLLTIGFGFKNNYQEYFFQAMRRVYYPKFSRSTSLNFGLSYYYAIQKNDFNFVTNKNEITTRFFSIPIYIQQNILNKNIRPYVFAGLNLSYLSEMDADGNELIKKGFQNNYGIGYGLGFGLEVDIYEGFFMKGEYRDETYQHPILLGIGYLF